MSKKSRERRAKRNPNYVFPDDHMIIGKLEIERFGNKVLISNNSTPTEVTQRIQNLASNYQNNHDVIARELDEIREKICQCDPLSILLYFKSLVALYQLNMFSESEYSTEANAAIRAFEYIQAVLVSSNNNHNLSMTRDNEEHLFEDINSEFCKLYQEILVFYFSWGAHLIDSKAYSQDIIDNLVEAQNMYWVRGKRYQIFELEPIRKLLPPHDEILKELYGVSSEDIICGLDKLRYSLSQGYADVLSKIRENYNMFCESVSAGADIEVAMKNAETSTTDLVDKAFGPALNDVHAITGLDTRFIDALSLEVSEYTGFFDGSEFSGWPIVELPIVRKPFIKINGTSYCFLYYNFFDNIYRNIQRLVHDNKPEYIEIWKERQCIASETMVKELFLQLLPHATAYTGNYYPVHSSLKNTIENDIILIYNDYLFIIEVKAGSFPTTPPITDFEAHMRAYKALIEAADSQCNRTYNYIAQHTPAKFYDRNKNTKFEIPDLSSFDEIFTFSVTIENINEVASKAEKINFLTISQQTIVISYDDLLSYVEYFDSPIIFLHYLKQRKAAVKMSKYHVFDELDHLGLYIYNNLYSYSPPQHSNVNQVFPTAYRQSLDKYFGMLYSVHNKAEKPVQSIPKEILDIISFCDSSISPENIKFAHYLLDLSGEARNDFSNQLQHAINMQHDLGKMTPIIALGDIRYFGFISTPGSKSWSHTDQYDYVYAVASRNVSLPIMWISLSYDLSGRLLAASGKKCSFGDLKPLEAKRLKLLGEEKALELVKMYSRSHGKIGRNDACPCGSGKKYKHCCMPRIDLLNSTPQT